MENINDVLTDEQIKNAFANSDFGDYPKRYIIANALLKYASGYSTGRPIEIICAELGLIGKTRNLTKLGKRFLFAAYNYKLSV